MDLPYVVGNLDNKDTHSKVGKTLHVSQQICKSVMNSITQIERIHYGIKSKQSQSK